MKKTIYISLAGVLGILLSFLFHVLIEIPIINLLVSDFEKYNLGLSWEQWFFAHYLFTIALFILGLGFGINCGFKWWQYIYVDKKYRGTLFKI